MKKIFLAKKGKRILSRLIDFSIVAFLSIFIFMTFVFPNTFDEDKFNANSQKILELYNKTELFIIDSNGNYTSKVSFNNLKELKDIYSFDCKFNDEEFKDVRVLESLYNYYTSYYALYNENSSNLSINTFKEEKLKIGTPESNILNFDHTSMTITLIDDSKLLTTLDFIVVKYAETCKSVITTSEIGKLTTENQTLFLSSLSFIFPILILISLVFDLIIPLFSKNGQTIGKHIFKLGLVSQEGYTYKKQKLIIRWLAYLLLELICGIFTFGGTILISYTMFLFCKKRKCIHDFVSFSVVIDLQNSLFFDNEKEEAFYLNRKTRRGV